MLFLEQKYFLGDHNLSYTDKMSMASGVEVRVPFLDPDLVQFAAGPGKVDLEESRGRPAAAVDYLPPQDRLWRAHTPLVDDALSAPALRARGLFNPTSVAKLIRDDREGRIDGAYNIFALLCVELWCRLSVDRTLRSVAARPSIRPLASPSTRPSTRPSALSFSASVIITSSASGPSCAVSPFRSSRG